MSQGPQRRANGVPLVSLSTRALRTLAAALEDPAQRDQVNEVRIAKEQSAAAKRKVRLKRQKTARRHNRRS